MFPVFSVSFIMPYRSLLTTSAFCSPPLLSALYSLLSSFIITSMDAFFLDPNLERFPPESVRILNLHTEPYPDGQRVRVQIELSPFLKRPEIELTLTDDQGNSCGSVSLIEPMGWKLELTMHIRPSPPAQAIWKTERNLLTLTAILSYPDLGETDRRQVTFETPLPQ